MPMQPMAAPPPILKKSAMATLREVVAGIGTYVVLALLLVTIVYVAILIWSPTEVLPQIGTYRTYLYLITPWLLNIAELGGPYFAAYYLILVVTIIISFAVLMWKSRKGFIAELAMKSRPEGHSPLYILGTIYFAALSFTFVYYFVLGLLGVNPNTPPLEDKETWKLLYGYANAAVWEEIVSRLLLIGVPLLIVHSISKKREGWKRYFLGGGFKIGTTELFFLVFSAAMFGTAHVFAWDASKIPSAFVGGLAFGYLFLRLGIYAAIMMHFIWDYISIPMQVFPGIGSTIVMGLLIISWVAIGAVYIVAYSSKIVGFFLRRDVWPYSASAQVAVATGDYHGPYQIGTDRSGPDWSARSGGFQFSCRYCGNTEARYREGVFECTRCGRRI